MPEDERAELLEATEMLRIVRAEQARTVTDLLRADRAVSEHRQGVAGHGGRGHPGSARAVEQLRRVRLLHRLAGGSASAGRPGLDPGYSKLLHRIEDAKAPGVDRVGHATYQTVLGTAPPLAAAKDPVARQSDEVIDYLTEADNSPNRDQLVEILLKDEQVTRKELAAAFEAQRANQAQRAEQRAAGGTETPPARPTAGTGGALVAGLLALAEQSARLVKRFPGLVWLDVAEQADAAVGGTAFITSTEAGDTTATCPPLVIGESYALHASGRGPGQVGRARRRRDADASGLAAGPRMDAGPAHAGLV
ncbi:hypothetical protein ABZ907_45515 [Nonomuraea wenchangensis]